MLASIQDEMNLNLLNCEFQKYEVMTMSVVGGQPKRTRKYKYEATKHIERTFLITDYYLSILLFYFTAFIIFVTDLSCKQV